MREQFMPKVKLQGNKSIVLFTRVKDFKINILAKPFPNL